MTADSNAAFGVQPGLAAAPATSIREQFRDPVIAGPLQQHVGNQLFVIGVRFHLAPRLKREPVAAENRFQKSIDVGLESVDLSDLVDDRLGNHQDMLFDLLFCDGQPISS